MRRFSESLALGFSLMLSLALRVSLVLFLRCAFPSSYLFRCALPSSYLLRCVLPSSYLLRCVLPSSYLLRCVLPSCVAFYPLLALHLTLPSCFCVAPYPRVSALRATLLFLNCVACYPLVALRLSSSVCATCLSIVVRLRVPFLIFLSRYRSFPYLFSISPFLSPISYLPSSISYLLSSPLSHISPPISYPPPLSHILPPYPISPSLSPIPYLLSSSPIPYLLPSPLSHISFPLPYPISPFIPHILSPPTLSPFLSSPYLISTSPPISFSLIPRISFPLLPYLLSFPLLSPYPKPSGRHCSPARWTSRPRWCNAQECMERPMSVYIRVYTFARPSPASSAVSSLSGVGGSPWSRARARIYYLIVSNHVKKASKFSFVVYFSKKGNTKNHFGNIFFTCSIEFFSMLMCGCVGGSACTQISCAFCKYESAFEYSPVL